MNQITSQFTAKIGKESNAHVEIADDTMAASDANDIALNGPFRVEVDIVIAIKCFMNLVPVRKSQYMIFAPLIAIAPH